jgi:site-specific DNA recombinase
MNKPVFPSSANAMASGGQPRRHVIYTRVSTDDQAREGVSLIAQREACVMLCKLRGFTDPEAIEDAGYSAKSLNRPGVSHILSEIEAGRVQTLVVWRLDRLSRTLRDLLDLVAVFDRRHVTLVSVMEQLDTSTPIGRLMLAMLGAVAQWERESIAERVKLGIRHRKAQGGFTGGYAPTATQVIGTPGNRQLVPDPQWAPIASQAWGRVISGATLAQTAQWLADQGVPPPRAGSKMKVKAWNKQNVQEWLTNPRLIGVLIDRAQFEACKATLAGRFSPKNVGGRAIGKVAASDRVWPLQGLARCAHCGAAMAGSVSYGRGKVPHYYLRCTYRLKGKGCTAPDLPAEAWERAVIDLLVQSAHGQGDLLTALEANQREQAALAAPAKERRDRLTQERDAIQQRLDRLLDLVAGGEAPAKSVAPKIAEQQMAIDGLDRQIAGCDAEIAASAMSQANADHLLAHWRTCVQGLADEPPALQRQTLQAVVKEVHLGSGKDLRLLCWPLRPDGDGGGKLAPPPSQPTHDGPNAANPGNKTTTVGSDGSRVWRRTSYHVRTDPLFSYIHAQREGRSHRWLVSAGALARKLAVSPHLSSSVTE